MDEKQNEWLKQFSTNHGRKEFFRLSLAMSFWIFLIILFAIVLNRAVYTTICFITMFVTMFVFPFFALRWKPAYSVYRKLVGNRNLPLEPMPRSAVKISRQPRPWWSYLSGLWFGLMTLIALYFAIKYFLK